MSEDLDLDHLARALKQATPSPETRARSAALAAAQAEFARIHAGENSFQGSAAPIRPKPVPRMTRWLTGGRKMMQVMTSRAALATTGGLVAAGLAVVLILPQDLGLPVALTGGRTGQVELERPVATETVEIGADDGVAEQPNPTAPFRAIRVSPQSDEVAGLTDTARMRIGVAPDRARTLESTGLSQVAPSPSQSQGHKSAPDTLAFVLPPEDAPVVAPESNTEAFPQVSDNPVKMVSAEPVSTFSVDVDMASWAVVRSSIMNGALPPRDAVRVEEMVNYFSYDYPAPDGDQPFSVGVSVTQTPWNAETRLVRIGLQGEMPMIAERPPLNLVFLVDTSGSMNQPDKLPLLKQALGLMLPELRAEDQVAIVTYAGSAGVALEPTSASDRRKILAALDAMAPGGGTAGQAGLQSAYDLAREMSEDGEVSRILLATDGDFNIGISDPEALKAYVERQREDGAYLSVLGFGRGNLDDATMQALAQNGNGTASYIDTLQEAQKVLVDQLSGALFPIADDVKVQVEFNPAEVAEYRLIGYETRALRREDFNNDRVDAGEIGAGLQVTALYEVTPPGSPALLNEPSRYGASVAEGTPGELGFLRLRYKAPGADDSRLIETPIPAVVAPADAETGFAAAIAGFGQLLRGSVYLGDWSYADAIQLAENAKGPDRFGYRAEAVRLMRLAQSLDR